MLAFAVNVERLEQDRPLHREHERELAQLARERVRLDREHRKNAGRADFDGHPGELEIVTVCPRALLIEGSPFEVVRKAHVELGVSGAPYSAPRSQRKLLDAPDVKVLSALSCFRTLSRRKASIRACDSRTRKTEKRAPVVAGLARCVLRGHFERLNRVRITSINVETFGCVHNRVRV
eukprot:Amastigsp_a339294_554.p1 type:complete len:178 gc:universal Amastigsp_a339294_554:848-315(-)